ncbi:MAG: phosphatase PAP2 family protein [Spirochaetales bacterium]|nr:phosphatase PAP2 family protein [Spirochaetales bacterium]
MGENVLLFFQNIESPVLDYFFELVTMLGEKNILIAVIAWMFWNVDKKKGFILSFTLLFSLVLNTGIKIAFHRQRPFELLSEIAGKRVQTATGYSFPSGHTQGASTFYLTLALLFKKWWIYAAALSVSLLVAVSRLYLGVHWPVDVIGGLILGYTAAIVIYRILSALYDRTVSRDLFIVFSAIGILLFLSGFLIINRIYFSGILVLTDLMKTAGIFTGVSVGFILEGKFVDFSVNSSFVRRALRFVVGITGTLSLVSGLKIIFPAVDAFHFFRYALIGLWITWLYPAAGKRIGLFN